MFTMQKKRLSSSNPSQGTSITEHAYLDTFISEMNSQNYLYCHKELSKKQPPYKLQLYLKSDTITAQTRYILAYYESKPWFHEIYQDPKPLINFYESETNLLPTQDSPELLYTLKDLVRIINANSSRTIQTTFYTQLPEILKSNKDIALAVCCKHIGNYRKLPDSFKSDDDFINLIINKDAFSLLHHVPYHKLSDTQLLEKIARFKPKPHYSDTLPESINSNTNHMLTLIKIKWEFIQASHKRLLNNEEFMLASIAINPHTFLYASNDLKGNQEFVKSAVQKNGLAVLYASTKLKENNDITAKAKQAILNAIQKNDIAVYEPYKYNPKTTITEFSQEIGRHLCSDKDIAKALSDKDPFRLLVL